MSQLATTTPDTDIVIQRESAAFELLQRQAKMLASSTLVPKDFQGNMANCAIGLNIAKRLGADPFMVLQNIDIIHGRPSFRATFLIAMVNASGRFEPLQFKMDGEKETRSCIAWTKDLKTKEVLEGPEITMGMAKAEGWLGKNGSKWQTMPELMLRYRAAAFFARLYAPDITLGMQTAEELHDTNIRDVTPPPPALFREAPPLPHQKADNLFDVEAVALADQVLAFLAKDKLEWPQVMQYLLDNGVLDGKRDTPADCTDDELRQAIGAWAQVVAGLGVEA